MGEVVCGQPLLYFKLLFYELEYLHSRGDSNKEKDNEFGRWNFDQTVNPQISKK